MKVKKAYNYSLKINQRKKSGGRKESYIQKSSIHRRANRYKLNLILDRRREEKLLTIREGKLWKSFVWEDQQKVSNFSAESQLLYVAII